MTEFTVEIDGNLDAVELAAAISRGGIRDTKIDVQEDSDD